MLSSLGRSLGQQRISIERSCGHDPSVTARASYTSAIQSDVTRTCSQLSPPCLATITGQSCEARRRLVSGSQSCHPMPMAPCSRPKSVGTYFCSAMQGLLPTSSHTVTAADRRSVSIMLLDTRKVDSLSHVTTRYEMN
jgi:hypothetical protein